MTEDIQYITEEKYQELLDAIPALHLEKLTHADLRLLYQTIYEGALRVSEATALTPNDLDLNNKKLIIRCAKGGKKRCKCSKWEKNKLIQVNDDCPKCLGWGKYRVKEFAWVSPQTFDKLVKLAQSRKKDERLFPTDRKQMWKWTKDLGKIIGVKLSHEEKHTTNLFPHVLRHSRPIHLLNTNKFSINEVMVKMRHKSLQPTTTYVKVSNESIQAKEFEK